MATAVAGTAAVAMAAVATGMAISRAAAGTAGVLPKGEVTEAVGTAAAATAVAATAARAPGIRRPRPQTVAATAVSAPGVSPSHCQSLGRRRKANKKDIAAALKAARVPGMLHHHQQRHSFLVLQHADSSKRPVSSRVSPVTVRRGPRRPPLSDNHVSRHFSVGQQYQRLGRMRFLFQ